MVLSQSPKLCRLARYNSFLFSAQVTYDDTPVVTDVSVYVMTQLAGCDVISAPMDVNSGTVEWKRTLTSLTGTATCSDHYAYYS